MQYEQDTSVKTYMKVITFSSPTTIQCQCCNKIFSQADNVTMYKWDTPTKPPPKAKLIYCDTCHFTPGEAVCECYTKKPRMYWRY